MQQYYFTRDCDKFFKNKTPNNSNALYMLHFNKVSFSFERKK